MTSAVVAPTVDDAVRSHVSWMTALAGLPVGTSWTDGPLHWVYDGPYGTLHALFPDDVPVDAARRGLVWAAEHDAAHVAIWSAVDVARPELADVGFEVGWAPSWMGAATAGFDVGPVRLSRRVVPSKRAAPRESARQPLLGRDDTRRAEARGADGRYAGRAWGHVGGGVAGLYDTAVRERRPHRAQRDAGRRAALLRLRLRPARHRAHLVVARWVTCPTTTPHPRPPSRARRSPSRAGPSSGT